MPKITQQKTGSRLLNFLLLIPFHFPMNDWELVTQLPGPGSVLWLPWPNTSLNWGQTVFSHSIMVGPLGFASENVCLQPSSSTCMTWIPLWTILDFGFFTKMKIQICGSQHWCEVYMRRSHCV